MGCDGGEPGRKNADFRQEKPGLQHDSAFSERSMSCCRRWRPLALSVTWENAREKTQRATMDLADPAFLAKNIGIIHNREFEDGVLRLELYDKPALDASVALLKKHHYVVYER